MFFLFSSVTLKYRAKVEAAETHVFFCASFRKALCLLIKPFRATKVNR